jgi:hypothetical protein
MKPVPAVLSLVLLAAGCDATGPLSLFWARFRVEDTSEFTLCGIPLDDLGSLSAEQTAEVLFYWLQGECPVDFNLGVGMKNLNIGSQWVEGFPLTLVRLDYDVFLDPLDEPGGDSVQVATGVFTGEFGIPEDGRIVVLGLGVSFDAFDLLEILGPEGVIDLMLAVGGIDGDVRDSEHLGRLSLFAVPEVDSPLGSMVWEDGFSIGLDWTSGGKP